MLTNHDDQEVLCGDNAFASMLASYDSIHLKEHVRYNGIAFDLPFYQS